MDDAVKIRHSWRVGMLLAVAVVCPLLLGRGMATYFGVWQARVLGVEHAPAYLFEISAAVIFSIGQGLLLYYLGGKFEISRKTARRCGLLCGGLLFFCMTGFQYTDFVLTNYRSAVEQFRVEQPTLPPLVSHYRAFKWTDKNLDSFVRQQYNLTLYNYCHERFVRPDTDVALGILFYWFLLIMVSTWLTAWLAGWRAIPGRGSS